MSSWDRHVPQVSQTQNLLPPPMSRGKSDGFLASFRSKSVEFVPFVNERDAMGRLRLKKKDGLAQQRHSQGHEAREDLQHKETTQSNQKIDRAIQLYFKKINLQDKQLKRGSPTKIVLVYDHLKADAQPADEGYDAATLMDKVKFKNKSVQLPHPTRQNSNKKSPTHRPTNLIKLQLQNPEQNQSKDKKSMNSSMPNLKPCKQKKHWESEKLTRVEFDHPELQRYRQIQKLSVKVFPDYENGHNRFFEKMKESRHIVQNIKQEINFE